MTYNMHLVENYLIAVGVITQIILITLQLGAFRKTRHPSLAVMSVASAFNVLYVLTSYGARHFPASGHNPLVLYLLAAALLTVQSAILVWSVSSLFRAFERACSPRDSA